MGTATAMAAAAVTEMIGGSPEQACQAAGLVLKTSWVLSVTR